MASAPNARFIFRAVNSHYPLLEALELLYLGVTITGGAFPDKPAINLDSEIAVKARAAIELARKPDPDKLRP